MNYQYTYLVLGILLFLIWIILYLYRKDLRKEILIISLLFGLGGILSEFVYITDWWRPLTITKTLIGLEDFLFGFSVGGIATSIYKTIFKKKIKFMKRINKKTRDIFIIFIILFFGTFYIFKINSFYSSIIAFSASTLYIWIKRKDLIPSSIFSGFFMLIIGTLIYSILNLIYPGFVQEFWFLDNEWYAKLIFGIPIREYIWYFLAGAFIGPLYEYWKEGRLINNDIYIKKWY